MKKLLFGLLFPLLAYANPPIVWGPNNQVQLLQPGILFAPGISSVASGTADPTVTAQVGNKASLYLSSVTGSLYKKTDTGSSTNWLAINGTGTLTNLGLIGSNIFSISGSPVTSAGTFNLNLSNQTANTVFAGATSGGTAVPSFRSLVAADIPSLDATKVTTGTIPVPRGGTGAGTFTTGSIIFANTTGTAALVQDNAKLFWDDVNFRLGVGTSSPTSDIQTAGRITAGTFAGNGSLINSISAGSINAGTLSPLFGGTGAGSFTTGSVVVVDGAGAYTQDNANFFWDSSNRRLGIGNAAPATTLDVTGKITVGSLSAGTINGTASASFTGTVTAGTFSGNGSLLTNLSANSVSTGTLALSAGGTGTGAFTAGSVLFAGSSSVISQSNSTFFWDNANKFLGLQTNSPAAPIHIANINFSGTPVATGNYTRFSGGTFTDNATVGTGTAGNFVSSGYAAATLAASNSNVTTTSVANFRIAGPVMAGTNETVTSSYTMLIPAGSTVNGGTTVNGYGLSVTAPNSATNNYVATFLSGNTGFGMTNPLAPVDVLATAAVVNSNEQLNLRSDRQAITAGELIGGVTFRSDDTSLSAPGQIVNYIDAIAEGTHTTTVLDTGLAFGVTTGTIMSEQMRLSGTGSLGIGTNTPGQRLHVIGAAMAGTLMAAGTGTAAAPTFTISGDTDTGWFSPAANQMALSTAGTERTRIDAGGGVAIGTTAASASALFDVASSTRGFLPPRLSTTAKNAIPSPASGLTLYDSTTNSLTYYNGSAWAVSGTSVGTFKVTTYTSGTGTHNVTAGALSLRMRMIGGGGGGGGSGTSGGNGATGGSSTFSTSTATGGTQGGGAGGRGGGTVTNCDVAITGGSGGGGDGNVNERGANGGQGAFGGGAPMTPSGASAGDNGQTNTGGGGAGAGDGATAASGAGGGAGGYCEKTFNAPLSAYAYGVGTGASGGVAGTGGAAGGNGGSGIIIIQESF